MIISYSVSSIFSWQILRIYLVIVVYVGTKLPREENTVYCTTLEYTFI